MKTFTILSLLVLFYSTSLLAQEQKEPPFSHKGFKVALGLVGFDNEFDTFGGKMEEGGGGYVSLGWGFSDNVSLWIAGFGVEYPKSPARINGAGFGGIEIDLQYKFVTRSPFQPYGKIGVGGYGIGQSGVVYTGGGVAGALGADYFFSPNVGIGIELQFKGIEYSHRTVEINGDDVTTEIDPTLEGKSRGIMFTLTLQ